MFTYKMKHTTQIFDIFLLQINNLLMTVTLLPATPCVHTSQLVHCLCVFMRLQPGCGFILCFDQHEIYPGTHSEDAAACLWYWELVCKIFQLKENCSDQSKPLRQLFFLLNRKKKFALFFPPKHRKGLVLQSPSNCGCFSTETVNLLLLLADGPISIIFNNFIIIIIKQYYTAEKQ